MFMFYLSKFCKTIETGKVSMKNGVCSVLAPFLGVFGTIETFETGYPLLQRFLKTALKLFRFYPLKTQSLSILIKR
jgi:hypothetical protein